MYMDLSEIYITLGKQGSKEKYHLERAESHSAFFTHNQNAACIIKKGSKQILNYKHLLYRVIVPVFITIFPYIAQWISREEKEKADTLSKIIDIDDWGISFPFFFQFCRQYVGCVYNRQICNYE